MVRDMEKQ